MAFFLWTSVIFLVKLLFITDGISYTIVLSCRTVIYWHGNLVLMEIAFNLLLLLVAIKLLLFH